MRGAHGLAPSAFAEHRDRRAKAEGVTSFSYRNPNAHNMYLQVAFQSGAIGLVLYLWMWGAVLVRTFRALHDSAQPRRSALAAGTLCSLLGAMVFGLFQNHFTDAEVQAAMLMFMGLALHAADDPAPVRPAGGGVDSPPAANAGA